MAAVEVQTPVPAHKELLRFAPPVQCMHKN